MTTSRWLKLLPGALVICATPVFAVDLREAVQSALNTNPEIRQAVSNRAATLEERVEGEARFTCRRFRSRPRAAFASSTTPAASGIADKTLYPIGGELIVDQTVFDGGGRGAEVRRRRPDGRRRGAGRGALRICRAQRRPRLYRLSAATAAGRHLAGQCRIPRTARR